MTTPKAIAYKSSADKSTPTSELEKLIEGPSDEILSFSTKYNGYKMNNNLQTELVFMGDEEDYLNAILDNHDAIKLKYKLEDKIVQFNAVDTYFNNVFQTATIHGLSKKSDKLNLMPAGIYRFVFFDGHYPGFAPFKINTDEYIEFENSEVMELQKAVTNFFKNRSIYEDHGVRHKGSSLVFGSPGQGKSTCLMNIINRPEFAGVYVIFIPKHMSFKYLDEFKDAFNGHDVLIVMEEMTERLGQGTEDILNFLDGYSSWNNCYVIATTNYPEVLPPNLVDRPGRFNNLVEIKPPTDVQKTYFLTKKGFSEDDIKEVLPRCKDFSLDYISQLALTAKLQNLKLSESFTILENNKKKVKGAFKGKSNLGL